MLLNLKRGPHWALCLLLHKIVYSTVSSLTGSWSIPQQLTLSVPWVAVIWVSWLVVISALLLVASDIPLAGLICTYFSDWGRLTQAGATLCTKQATLVSFSGNCFLGVLLTTVTGGFFLSINFAYCLYQCGKFSDMRQELKSPSLSCNNSTLKRVTFNYGTTMTDCGPNFKNPLSPLSMMLYLFIWLHLHK